MSIFDKILKESESVFRNDVALSYEYIPKLIPYRESQQRQVATCIAPLFHNRNGRNLIIYGPPGVGKTVATRHVLIELEEKTDQIVPLYVNCWQRTTSYKIMLDICDQIGYKFTHNKKTDELFDVIKHILNKKSTVFVFDEIDKCEDTDFLYWILTDILNKTVILLTNFKEVITTMDTRIKSRLTPETVEFHPYNAQETRGILDTRRELAFFENTWKRSAFDVVVDKTVDLHDIRSGLYLLKESGLSAEERASKIIDVQDAHVAIGKLEEFKIKNAQDLPDDTRIILDIIKNNNSGKIGDLYKIYSAQGGGGSYKTFQRKVDKLAQGRFITIKKTQGGSEGNTTLISYNTTTKTLNEF